MHRLRGAKFEYTRPVVPEPCVLPAGWTALAPPDEFGVKWRANLSPHLRDLPKMPHLRTLVKGLIPRSSNG
jgi:hypothetical protein